MNMHENKMPISSNKFKCTECEASFTYPQSLILHNTIHMQRSSFEIEESTLKFNKDTLHDITTRTNRGRTDGRRC